MSRAGRSGAGHAVSRNRVPGYRKEQPHPSPGRRGETFESLWPQLSVLAVRCLQSGPDQSHGSRVVGKGPDRGPAP